jgi:membrane protein
MNLSSIPRKLFRTLARVIPQCGMVSQAVAFNIFLAFFSSLLAVIGLISSSLRGAGGRELDARLSAFLPPGSWQLITDFLLRREVNAWAWVSLGWLGTLLVGLQAMKLTMEGIRLIYGDSGRHSFLGRQLRGLLLFSVSIVAWFMGVALSIFGLPLRQWMTRGFTPSPWVLDFWAVILQVLGVTLTMLVLAFIYCVARPGGASLRSVLPGAAAATILWWCANLLFGICVRKMHYGPVYGGLAAAIGLMVWMEYSTMIVFIGAAWNAENAAPGGKAKT